MGTLTIQPQRVTEAPSPFQLESDSEWWESARELLRVPGVEVRRPFQAELEAYRLGARLLFRGRLLGAVELTCSRCMEPYGHEFSEPLELLLEPAARPDEIPDGGMELDPEDIEIGRYAGDEIDLGLVILEILALAWPMQPRCAEDCLGLCPVCGSNLNRNPCSCEAQTASRPLAALGKLLERSK